MDIDRIQREFLEAQKTFAVIQIYPTTDGKVYVRTGLQAPDQMYILSIKFPETYPHEMPRVYIDTPPITMNTPHRYQNGNICYLHPTMWNPGIHNLTFVVARAAKWLNKYEVWKRQGQWPGAQIKH